MTDASTGHERRRFSRFPVTGAAMLHGPTGEQVVRVRDISLRGVFLEVGERWAGDETARYRLTLRLSGDIDVNMELSLRRRTTDGAGFLCESIDLDSMIHLRRLAELNLGDPTLLERELLELCEGA